MFAYPATELFNGENRRVVWSIEEYEGAIAEGWSADKPAADDLPKPAKSPKPQKA